ncbi:MAG TPA: hypothetical protein PK358_05045 [Spirochaetota bacterium]|nr:hypothetical protein [Spirochaetota bacterium]
MSCRTSVDTKDSSIKIIKNERIDIVKEVIEKDTRGIKTREEAIQFYIDKGVSLYFDNSMNLTSFDCSRPGGLTDDDMKYIVFFPEAGAVHLSDKTITDEVFYYFQDLNMITVLSLYNTGVSGDGFRYLLEKRKLIIFDFGGSPITDVGLNYLSRINFENKVIILNLKGSKITDEGMKYIQKIRFGKGRVNLRHTSVTDAGIRHLSGFKELVEVDLIYTGVTDRGGEWLKKQIPGANITWGVLSPAESQ